MNYGLQHRYYARPMAGYPAGQFPRGHLGLGQGTYCLDSTGEVVPCGTSQVMATLPALPGGGYIASGQNVQTAPPTATSATLPALQPTAGSTFMEYLPLIAGGVFVALLASSGGVKSHETTRERKRRR